MVQLTFFYLAAVIVLTSFLVVAVRNPVYSVLSLLIMFFHVAGLYVTLHAEFVAAVQIIVYAGAILVLYLFVVMLLNVKREDRYHAQFPLGILLGLMILTEALLLLSRHGATGMPPAPPAAGSVPAAGNTEAIGAVLYSTYVFPFEVASLVLLVAMIGAIVLAKRDLFDVTGDK